MLRGTAAWLVPAGVLALAACPQTDEVVEPAAPAVATVNGQAITADALARRIRRFKQEHGELAFRSEEDRVKVRARLLEDRIAELLLLQAAERKRVQVLDEDVERAVLRARADYPGRSFEEHLAEEGITASELKTRLRERLAIQQLLRDEVNSRVAVTDAEIESWYADHTEEFDVPEQVRASQIVVKTEEEAKRLLQDLRSGKDFAELARRHSVAPEGAKGGDLGWFPRGVMPTPIDETCFELSVGRVSSVVESPYGYHLFKVMEHKDASRRELDDSLRQEIEQRLLREKEEAAEEAFQAGLRAAATIEIDEQILAEVR